MSYAMRVFWSGTMIDAYVIRVKSDNTADHAALKLERTAPKNVNIINLFRVKVFDWSNKPG